MRKFILLLTFIFACTNLTASSTKMGDNLAEVPAIPLKKIVEVTLNDVSPIDIKLVEGRDNLLFDKSLRKALPYDTNLPILEDTKCTLDARFNVKIKGLTVELKNKTKGEFTNVEWVFGDGLMSHNEVTEHTYEKEGMYYFSLTVYDNSTGCIDYFAGKYYLFDPSIDIGDTPSDDGENYGQKEKEVKETPEKEVKETLEKEVKSAKRVIQMTTTLRPIKLKELKS